MFRLRFCSILTVLSMTFLFGLPEAEAQSVIQNCSGGLGDFIQGCRVRVDRSNWSSAFKDYALSNGIYEAGARAIFIPAKDFEDPSQSLNRVTIIVGPYLPVSNFQSPLLEFEFVTKDLAPGFLKVRDELKSSDSSILYIGFGHREEANMDVPTRALAVKETLASFNNMRREFLKTNNPSQTVLIGISLGGVAGKIALKEFEDYGINHNVRTYISFDSPHQGVVAPLALQTLPLALRESFIHIRRDVGNGFFENLFLDVFNLLGVIDLGEILQSTEVPIKAASEVILLSLNSPVAIDLLVNNQATSPIRVVEKDRLVYSNISYLSRKASLPSWTRNISVVSGSIEGNELELGEQYFKFDTGEGPNDLQINVDARIPGLLDSRVWKSKVHYRDLSAFFRGDKFYLVPNDGNYTRATEQEILLERSACSYDTKVVQTMAKVVQSSLRKVWSNFSLSILEDKACFIPTRSALNNYRNSKNPSLIDFSSWSRVIGDSKNKEHLKISPAMVDEILEEIGYVFPKPERVPDESEEPSEGSCETGPSGEPCCADMAIEFEGEYQYVDNPDTNFDYIADVNWNYGITCMDASVLSTQPVETNPGSGPDTEVSSCKRGPSGEPCCVEMAVEYEGKYQYVDNPGTDFDYIADANWNYGITCMDASVLSTPPVETNPGSGSDTEVSSCERGPSGEPCCSEMAVEFEGKYQYVDNPGTAFDYIADMNWANGTACMDASSLGF